MRLTIAFLAGLIAASLLAQTRIRRDGIAPDYFTGGGTGTIVFQCITRPCEIDANMAVVPILPGQNRWTGYNDFSNALMTSPFLVADDPPTHCDPNIPTWYFNRRDRKLYVCNAPGVWARP